MLHALNLHGFSSLYCQVFVPRCILSRSTGVKILINSYSSPIFIYTGEPGSKARAEQAAVMLNLTRFLEDAEAGGENIITGPIC